MPAGLHPNASAAAQPVDQGLRGLDVGVERADGHVMREAGPRKGCKRTLACGLTALRTGILVGRHGKRTEPTLARLHHRGREFGLGRVVERLALGGAHRLDDPLRIDAAIGQVRRDGPTGTAAA